MDDNLRKLLGLSHVDLVGSVCEAEIRAGDIIMLGVPREAVERGHIETYLREFEKYGKRNYRGRVMLNFSGYDYDPREVYQVPEIRSWMSRLLKNVPHLFYFITPENYALQVAFLCLAPVAGTQGDQVSIDKAGAKRLIEKFSKSAVSYARQSKDSDAVQFAVANTILSELGYDQL